MLQKGKCSIFSDTAKKRKRLFGKNVGKKKVYGKKKCKVIVIRYSELLCSVLSLIKQFDTIVCTKQGERIMSIIAGFIICGATSNVKISHLFPIYIPVGIETFRRQAVKDLFHMRFYIYGHTETAWSNVIWLYECDSTFLSATFLFV